MTDAFKKKIPNYLTFLRILAIPFVIASFYFEGVWWTWGGCAIFVLASVTDFFDGHLARKYGSTSSLGKMLDPIADKLLVSATLLCEAFFDRLGIFGDLGVLPAAIILLREVLVSGMREFLSGINIKLPVTRLAKWKTGIQMTAIPMLMVGHVPPACCCFNIIGSYLIWVAAILTVITGFDYFRAGLKHLD